MKDIKDIIEIADKALAICDKIRDEILASAQAEEMKDELIKDAIKLAEFYSGENTLSKPEMKRMSMMDDGKKAQEFLNKYNPNKGEK